MKNFILQLVVFLNTGELNKGKANLNLNKRNSAWQKFFTYKYWNIIAQNGAKLAFEELFLQWKNETFVKVRNCVNDATLNAQF